MKQKKKILIKIWKKSEIDGNNQRKKKTNLINFNNQNNKQIKTNHYRPLKKTALWKKD